MKDEETTHYRTRISNLTTTMKRQHRNYTIGLLVAFLMIAIGCDSQNPERNTATSGRLLVLVDEMYEPLIRELADTFMSRTPARTITVQPLLARTAVQELINKYLADSLITDTTTRVAMILGRELLDDERQAIQEKGLDNGLIEIPIGYDGLAVVVPNSSPLQETTRERLKAALATKSRTANDVQEGAGTDVLRFIFTDPNSSAYNFIRQSLLENQPPASPARHYQTSDSVLEAVANNEGVGLMGWYPAHQDSARVQTLKMGFTDSTGLVHSATRVHTVTLVMDKYPLKLPLVGYTFASVNSLANGFLTWLALGQDAQEGLANRGLQPKNLRFRFTTE